MSHHLPSHLLISLVMIDSFFVANTTTLHDHAESLQWFRTAYNKDQRHRASSFDPFPTSSLLPSLRLVNTLPLPLPSPSTLPFTFESLVTSPSLPLSPPRFVLSHPGHRLASFASPSHSIPRSLISSLRSPSCSPVLSYQKLLLSCQLPVPMTSPRWSPPHLPLPSSWRRRTVSYAADSRRWRPDYSKRKLPLSLHPRHQLPAASVPCHALPLLRSVYPRQILPRQL